MSFHTFSKFNPTHTNTIVQVYEKLTIKDDVVRSAQSTINILCDFMRKMLEDNMDEFRGDTSAICDVCISMLR